MGPMVNLRYRILETPMAAQGQSLQVEPAADAALSAMPEERKYLLFVKPTAKPNGIACSWVSHGFNVHVNVCAAAESLTNVKVSAYSQK